ESPPWIEMVRGQFDCAIERDARSRYIAASVQRASEREPEPVIVRAHPCRRAKLVNRGLPPRFLHLFISGFQVNASPPPSDQRVARRIFQRDIGPLDLVFERELRTGDDECYQ